MLAVFGTSFNLKIFIWGIHVPIDSREIFLCGGDIGGVVRGEVPVDIVELDAV